MLFIEKVFIQNFLNDVVSFELQGSPLKSIGILKISFRFLLVAIICCFDFGFWFYFDVDYLCMFGWFRAVYEVTKDGMRLADFSRRKMSF